MRITSKGQVTIPVAIRRRPGLLPETEVEFEVEADAVRIRKAAKPPGQGRSLVARMTGKATTRMTTDEILSMTRG